MTLPRAGAQLVLDTSAYDSSIQNAMNQADDLQGKLNDLSTGDVAISTSVTTDAPSQSTLSQLHDLSDLAAHAYNFAVNLVSTGFDIFKDFNSFAVQPMLDLDDAVAKVNATTANAIPNARELIQNIYYDDLGKSVDEVGQLVAESAQLGLPVEQATRAALTFTHTWGDESSKTALETFGTLLKNNLVDNMQQASDLMAVFFQHGGNTGGDALNTFKNFSSAFKEMGLNGPQAFSAVQTMMQGSGFSMSAGDAAQVLQKINQALTDAAANPTGPAAKMLDVLHLENPKDAGKAMGADWLNGFAEALKNAPLDVADNAAKIFGGKGGAKFVGGLEAVSTNAGIFQNVVDAASVAATEIDNSLRGSIDDFVKGIQGAVENWLSSASVDLPGKIALLKQGIQDALATLQAGGSIENAFTVALKPIGFDDEFQKLENIFGEFIINLLGVIASIQDVLNKPEEAAATRQTISNLSQNQLAFQLKIANPDEMVTDIQNAVTRGVSSEGIYNAVSTAVGDLTKQGATDQAQQLLNEFSARQQLVATTVKPLVGEAQSVSMPISPDITDAELAKAKQKLVDKLNAQTGGAPIASVDIQQINVDQTAIAAMQKQIDDAVHDAALSAAKTTSTTPVSTISPIATATQGGLIDPRQLAEQTANATQLVNDKITNLATPMGDLSDKTDKSRTNIQQFNQSLDGTQQPMKKAHDNAINVSRGMDDLNSNMIPTNTTIQQTGASSVVTAGQLNNLNGTIIKLGQTAATVTVAPGSQNLGGGQGGAANPDQGGKKYAAGGVLQGVGWTGEYGPELISTDTSLAVLNNQTSQAIMAALSGAVFRGFGGGNNYRNNQITNVYQVPNVATADALGYRQAQQLRI